MMQNLPIVRYIFRVWLSFYAIALTFIPPLHLKSKTIFTVELLIFPLVVLAVISAYKSGFVRPNKKLLLLWMALVVAFVSGIFRADLSYRISHYALVDADFRWLTDGIRFVRWTLLFSVPWLLQNCRANSEDLEYFIRAVKYCVFVTAIFAILEHFNYLDFKQIFHEENFSSRMWLGRSYSTYQSPLESGLVFGSILALQIPLLTEGKMKIKDTVISLVAAAALLFTHSATAWISLVVALLIGQKHFNLVAPKKIIFVALAFIMAFILIYYFTPPLFFTIKYEDFLIRTRAWVNWLRAVPGAPWLPISGLGFSTVVTDNSLIFLLFTGGLLLLCAFLNWYVFLWKFISSGLKPFFIFWTVSWLALDSIGYWGIGRIAWVLLGFSISNRVRQE